MDPLSETGLTTNVEKRWLADWLGDKIFVLTFTVYIRTKAASEKKDNEKGEKSIAGNVSLKDRQHEANCEQGVFEISEFGSRDKNGQSDALCSFPGEDMGWASCIPSKWEPEKVVKAKYLRAGNCNSMSLALQRKQAVWAGFFNENAISEI